MNIDLFLSIHFTQRSCSISLGGKCFTAYVIFTQLREDTLEILVMLDLW